MYCGVCSAYGHKPSDCPNKRAWAIRQGKDATNIKNFMMIVDDSEKGIMDVLSSYNLKPGARIPKPRLRFLLRNLANSMNPPRLIQFHKIE